MLESLIVPRLSTGQNDSHDFLETPGNRDTTACGLPGPAPEHSCAVRPRLPHHVKQPGRCGVLLLGVFAAVHEAFDEVHMVLIKVCQLLQAGTQTQSCTVVDTHTPPSALLLLSTSRHRPPRHVWSLLLLLLLHSA